MSYSADEKRREPRRAADGAVRVRFANPQPRQIQGRLIDISPSGFRMAHDDASLGAGQMVEFAHAEASGQARVAWNRILEDRVETGFFVVGAGNSAIR